MAHKIIKLGSIFILLASCQSPDQPVNINLNELTIYEIHQAYKYEVFSSQDLVSTYLERIKSVDEEINAISIINPKALEIAKELDEEYQSSGVLQPLHGIPIIVKDNINTKGLPTTAGALALQSLGRMYDEPTLIKLAYAYEQGTKHRLPPQ